MAIDLKPEDLVINYYRGHKQSGFIIQIDQGVIITHKPTGAQAKCDKDRIQYVNKTVAMRMLTEKVSDIYKERQKRNEAQGKLDISNDRLGLPKITVTPVMPLVKPPKEEVVIAHKNEIHEAYYVHSGNSSIDYDGREWNDFVGGWEAAINFLSTK
jgi:protein subunit release factor B